jgi:hypothetical protein
MKIGRTVGFAVLLWVFGFIWGTVVFMTPALKELPSALPFSRYPAISAPLLVLFPLLSFYFAKLCVTPEGGRAAGLRAGLVFAATNLVMDMLILVLAFKSGWGYFASVSVWLAYAFVIYAAWSAGRWMEAAPPRG